MNRKAKNQEILKLLSDYVNKYPEQRFGQIIRNIGIVDTIIKDNGKERSTYFTNIFNEEPEQTLKRIEETPS